MTESQTGRGALVGGGLAAILASTCCLGPLVLVSAGVGGAWISTLTGLPSGRLKLITVRRASGRARSSASGHVTSVTGQGSSSWRPMR